MAHALELFRKLGAGAKFDFKRFKNDAQKFQLVKPSSKALPQPDIIKAVDFFENTRKTLEKAEETCTRSSAGVHQAETESDFKREKRNCDGQAEAPSRKKCPKTSHDTISDSEPKLLSGDVIEERLFRQETDVSSADRNGQTRTDEVRAIRKKNRIYVQGSDIPDPLESFEELQKEYGFHSAIIENVTRAGYQIPTPIQMQAIPVMMHRRELLACAPTGSGKTAAFILPILHQLKEPQKKGFRAVIVSPTRELAQQTYRELMRLSDGHGFRIHTIQHGAKAVQKFGPQTSQKFDILVTTPNRLVYLLQQDPPAVKLNNVEWLIIDESDKLFEGGKTGFRDQLAIIYQACDSTHVRRAMFSATFGYDVEQWCKLNLDNVVTVSVGQRNTANETIEQELVFVGGEYGKLLAVRNIFSKGFTPPVLIFVQSKERAKELFQELIYDGYNVDVIHADKTQTQRDNIVSCFRAGKIWVLIATELMGRGIDFKGVNLVINYDFPTSAISYIHRIGRTGRAGRMGRAVTFFTEDDTIHLRSIANVMRNAGCLVPDYMLQIRKLTKKKKRVLEKHAVKRDTIRTLPKEELRKAKRKRDMTKGKKKKPLTLDGKGSGTQPASKANEDSQKKGKGNRPRTNLQGNEAKSKRAGKGAVKVGEKRTRVSSNSEKKKSMKR